MTPVRIVKTARFKRIVISRSAAADDILFLVRSGWIWTAGGTFNAQAARGLYWSKASHYNDSLSLDSISGLDNTRLDVSTGFEGHSRYWGFSLRCLAIE